MSINHGPRSLTDGERERLKDAPPPLPYRPAADTPAIPTEVDGVALIAAERRRQVEAEGYTPEQDKGQSRGLSLAASCYAVPAYRRWRDTHGTPDRWPWAERYWKPTPDDRIRELVKAGALIAAAIDSLMAEGGGDDD